MISKKDKIVFNQKLFQQHLCTLAMDITMQSSILEAEKFLTHCEARGYISYNKYIRFLQECRAIIKEY